MAGEAIVSALAALGGAVVGAGASVVNASRTAARERGRQLRLDRRRYLEPLRLAALDLGVLLMHTDEALAAPATEQAGAAATDRPRLRHLRRPTFSPERRKHETEMLETVFGKLKQDRGAQGEFMAWANGEGTFAVATLYRTVVYCWAAQRIKQGRRLGEPVIASGLLRSWLCRLIMSSSRRPRTARTPHALSPPG